MVAPRSIPVRPMSTDVPMGAGGARAIPSFEGLSAERPAAHRGWFTRVAAWYLRRRYGKARVSTQGRTAQTQTERAQSVIRRACIKSAVTGAGAGILSTGATVLTAETEGLAAIVTIPVAAAAIGGEMFYRAIVHLEMTCDLADIFEVPIHPDDPADLWRIFALAFRADGRVEEDPDHALVERIVEVEGHEVGESIGSRLVGESVMRNVVPFIGIASSSITNWRTTRRVGDTVRRFFRYQRALNDAFSTAALACSSQMDLLVEGLWFIFTADGRLIDEEAAVLASALDRLDPVMRGAVTRRFTEDEGEWVDRLETVPDSMRDAFMHALLVAAAVDKEVSLPERKILRRAAKHLGREFDEPRLAEMIREFGDVGVLAEA